MVRFQYSLARELGMTHRQLVSTMTTRELIDWMAFYRLEHEERDKAKQAADDRMAEQQALRALRGY
jgi:hypothetical protein